MAVLRRKCYRLFLVACIPCICVFCLHCQYIHVGVVVQLTGSLGGGVRGSIISEHSGVEGFLAYKKAWLADAEVITPCIRNHLCSSLTGLRIGVL